MPFIVLVFSLTTAFLLNQTKALLSKQSQAPWNVVCSPGDHMGPSASGQSVGGRSWRLGPGRGVTLGCSPDHPWYVHPHTSQGCPRVSDSRHGWAQGGRWHTGNCSEPCRVRTGPGASAGTRASWQVTWSQSPVEPWVADCVVTVIFSQGDKGWNVSGTSFPSSDN